MSKVKKPDSNEPAIKQVDPATLLLGEHRAVRGIASDIKEITLEGEEWVATITDTLVDAQLVRSIDQASTVSLRTEDGKDRLLLSPLFSTVQDIELDGLWFRFVQATKDDPFTTELNYESLSVARLRSYKGPKKAFRDMVTRAEFVAGLCTEAGVPLWCPDLHVVQPIAGDSGQAASGPSPSPSKGAGGKPDPTGQAAPQTPTAGSTAGPAKAEPSAATSSKVQQGITGKVEPVQVGQAMLANGFPADVDEISMGIAIVGCESGFDGNASAAGYWGEITGGVATAYNCPQTSCTQDLMLSTAAAHRSYQDTRWGAWLPYEVANGNNCPGSAYQSKYRAAAEEAIRRGGGNIAAGAAGNSPGSTTTKNVRYAFEVKANETYWDAMQRLAEEVNWRCFEANGIVFFADDFALRDAQEPQMVVRKGDPGIDWVGFDYDYGKPVGTAKIYGRVKTWAAPPGTVVEVEEQGPVDGAYLVSEIDTPLIVPDTGKRTAEVTVARPQPPKAEPAAQTISTTTPGGGTGAGGDTGAHPPGIGTFDNVQVCNWIIPWLQKARQAGWGGRLNSGFRSNSDQCRTCQGICGNCNGCGSACAPPGSSRHQGTKFPSCAIDVTDAQQLIGIFKKIGAPLIYNASDPCACHFSHDGH
jgi:hypothetical protein